MVEHQAVMAGYRSGERMMEGHFSAIDHMNTLYAGRNEIDHAFVPASLFYVTVSSPFTLRGQLQVSMCVSGMLIFG
jgi:hypothetical protein